MEERRDDRIERNGLLLVDRVGDRAERKQAGHEGEKATGGDGQAPAL
ncbi:MAG: hypothetical protein M3P84_05335 [Chloroflexota bacterium]|nr:hypothetical protein [Chloroflexota bacterium]